MWKTLVAFITALSFTSCATLQPVANLDSGTLQQAIQAGDQVRVITTDRRALELKVERITGSSLFGVDQDARRHELPFSTIRTLEKRVPRASSTSWTIAAVLAGLALIAVLLSDSAGGGRGGGDEGGY